MDTPSALSTELLDVIRVCLDAGKFKEALELPDDNKYADALKNNCWDLIPHLIERIQDDTIITWPAMQRCCERLLLVVADKANPEEVLLELIERIETSQNDAQFIAILLPLQSVLKRLIKKRGRSLEWCLNSMYSYIEKIPLPDNYDFTGKENLLRDCDPNARRILKIYSELPIFYDHFVKEAFKNISKSSPSSKETLLCFLIDLLGKPLAVMDMTYNDKTKSQCRICTENIFKEICILQPNLYKFMEYVDQKCHPNMKYSISGAVYEDAPTDIFLLEEKLSPLSLGVLYYLLFAEKLPVPLLPQIYNPTHIAQTLLDLCTHLIQNEEHILCHKGLLLTMSLIDMLPVRSPPSLLSSLAHPRLMKVLCNTAVYCPSEFLRKLAVVIIKSYILKFNNEGRYLFIVNLLPSLDHSGIKGYVISIYKEVLIEVLKDKDGYLRYYTGDRLRNVLGLCCYLPKGEESDLVEQADQIISALNLLRYLIIRDDDNITGVWNILKNIEGKFLCPLRKGIDMSRAHYEARLSDLLQGKTDNDSNTLPVSVNVGGSTLDNIPIENKKNIIYAGINALHLIDSLLCRLQECVNSKKVQNNILNEYV